MTDDPTTVGSVPDGDGSGITYAILGPLDVRRDGSPLKIGGPKARALLGMLLLDADRVVSSSRLIEGIWGEDAPMGVQATLQVHVSNLRKVLGPHVSQKGSLVEEDNFRFDFSHGQPMTADEIERVEDEVNSIIRQNAEAQTREMAPEKAIEAGAMALFGEKYGDNVRVLTLGSGLDDTKKPYSVELCGGTHVHRTGDIAVFSIVSETGVAAGVRRIVAVTGAAHHVDHAQRHARSAQGQCFAGFEHAISALVGIDRGQCRASSKASGRKEKGYEKRG